RKQLKKTKSTSNITSRPAKIQKMSSEELPSSIINTKMSLILFDEVDIVFNSDRGFLSAVQKFIKITKRPIVLTTNDERFRERFNSDIEAINLMKP
ncbi:hypothetical protein HELRODRAFT_138031, partial [Helobdella robusta]|uniref:ATPase AAA-type core domain-containing protein n=1 Tax=Helobdella robusta TaxID=6412 RepID=T1EIQ8_HELRO